MKIKYNDNAAPSKRGTVGHVSREVAATLMASGFAEIISLPRRGEAGWVEARIAQSNELKGAPDPYDVDPSPMQKAIEACDRGEMPHPFAQ